MKLVHCQTSSTTHCYRLTVSVASLKHSCLQTRSSVNSALKILLLLMRYINLRLLTYTGRWRVDSYIWYSEEGAARGRSPLRSLLTVPNVTAHPSTASEQSPFCRTAVKDLFTVTFWKNPKALKQKKLSIIWGRVSATPTRNIKSQSMMAHHIFLPGVWSSRSVSLYCANIIGSGSWDDVLRSLTTSLGFDEMTHAERLQTRKLCTVGRLFAESNVRILDYFSSVGRGLYSSSACCV